MGLRKMNTIGLEPANKIMPLSAIAYNVKKYLKFVQKRAKSVPLTPQASFSKIKAVL
jgi:hypothetical protein